MNLKQRREFEKKQRAERPPLPREEEIAINRRLKVLEKADEEGNSFLSNPYYLALFLWKVSYDRDFNPQVNSIEELHETEFKREVFKRIEKKDNQYPKINDEFFERIKIVLSIISYYLLATSLKQNAHQGVELTDIKLLQLFSKILREYNQKVFSNSQDEITLQRIRVLPNLECKITP